jgi:hypothetical protein
VTGQATGVVGSRVNVGCCWELFHTERSDWHSSGQGCSWSLFFDLRLIEEVVQLGAALHGKVDRSERFRILRTRLSRALVEDLRCVAVESLWSPVRTAPQNDKITFEFNSTRKRQIWLNCR